VQTGLGCSGASIPDDLGLGSDRNSSPGNHIAELGERARRCAPAMRPCPRPERAIELAFFSGLTQKEISEKLEEPIGTIKARIRRA